MLVLVRLLILMMKMMMMSEGRLFLSYSVSTVTITAQSGGAVLLSSDLQVLKSRQDIRWTNTHLVMSLRTNVTMCHHGRCELLSDGSLRFNRVQTEDAGSYSLEVFDEDGKLLMKKHFLLSVEVCLSADTSSSTVASVLVCCLLLLLLLFFIILFFLRRRRNQRMRTPGPLEENVYVVMHSHHGNKKKDGDDEEKQESNYVSCNPAVSMETPMPEQMDEDIYV
ncbi:uncharacterized protein LOC116400960 isoform X2 [Anarrhichthys ocellatus]|uniref:uncharacterized protein LOC116400960 isoform X2 n=1 Tax=Anarrhichthys ocellatus TaxID=433405 RepID=UPI0012ECE747|nr:uncharacterized protein LOC116400960 isoform X2 [Anarrhichthys ocellatus]